MANSSPSRFARPTVSSSFGWRTLLVSAESEALKTRKSFARLAKAHPVGTACVIGIICLGSVVLPPAHRTNRVAAGRLLEEPLACSFRACLAPGCCKHARLGRPVHSIDAHGAVDRQAEGDAFGIDHGLSELIEWCVFRLMLSHGSRRRLASDLPGERRVR